jgi:hypothetical protein
MNKKSGPFASPPLLLIVETEPLWVRLLFLSYFLKLCSFLILCCDLFVNEKFKR